MNLRTFLTAGALITGGLMLSRLLGLLREAMIAATYGISNDANMAIGLLVIPDYITGILIGTALGSALVPAFANRSDDERLALFWQAMLLSLCVFTAIGFLMSWQAEHVVRALHGQLGGMAEAAFFWAVMSMPLAGVSGVMIAWQQFHGRMHITAFANVVFNLVVVLGLWLAPRSLLALGISIFVAGLVRIAVQAVEFSGSGGSLMRLRQKWQITPRLLGHYLLAVSNAFFSLLPQYAPYLIITLLGGQLALFNYAFKLSMLPAMVLLTLVQMLLLPRFVHKRKDGQDVPEYARSFRIGFVFCVCVALTASMAGHALVSLCFGYGAMTEEHIAAAAWLFGIGIWAAPFIVSSFIWQQAFYACEKPGVPFKIGLAQALLSIPFVWFGQIYFAEAGAIAASVLLQLFSLVLLIVAASRRGMYRIGAEYKLMAQMLAAAIAAFIPLNALYHAAGFSPVAGAAAAVLMGGVVLAVSLLPDGDIRRLIFKKVARA